MASSRDIRVIRVNTLTRKISYRRMLRRIIIVGLFRKYLSIIYRG